MIEAPPETPVPATVVPTRSGNRLVPVKVVPEIDPVRVVVIPAVVNQPYHP